MTPQIPTIQHKEQLLTLLAKMGAISQSVSVDSMNRCYKSDNSIVTNVDLAVSDFLEQELRDRFGYPVISEETIESYPWQVRRELDKYWLIDPIDGTKAYATGGQDYCHMISFIDNGEAVFAGIFLPRYNNAFVIGGKNQGVHLGNLEYQVSYQGKPLDSFQVAQLVHDDLAQAFAIDVDLVAITSTNLKETELDRATNRSNTDKVLNEASDLANVTSERLVLLMQQAAQYFTKFEVNPSSGDSYDGTRKLDTEYVTDIKRKDRAGSFNDVERDFSLVGLNDVVSNPSVVGRDDATKTLLTEAPNDAERKHLAACSTDGDSKHSVIDLNYVTDKQMLYMQPNYTQVMTNKVECFDKYLMYVNNLLLKYALSSACTTTHKSPVTEFQSKQEASSIQTSYDNQNELATMTIYSGIIDDTNDLTKGPIIRLQGQHQIAGFNATNKKFVYKHSAGVKIYLALKEENACYFATGIMSEWDLAPAAAFINELGGVVFDLVTMIPYGPKVFNQDASLTVTPLVLARDLRDVLELFDFETRMTWVASLQERIQKRLQQNGVIKKFFAIDSLNSLF